MTLSFRVPLPWIHPRVMGEPIESRRGAANHWLEVSMARQYQRLCRRHDSFTPAEPLDPTLPIRAIDCWNRYAIAFLQIAA